MPQDAFTIKYVAEELSALLVGGKISKITQSDRDTLTLIIYTKRGSVKLDICLSAKGCRISLTDTDKPVPKVAPNFCMLLRKHLQNAEITAVTQIKFERVVVVDLDCTSEFELLKMKLYIELMGKYSNAVLVKDGVIVGALKTTAIGENTRRVLFPGVDYTPPEPQDKIAPDDINALAEALDTAAGDKAKFLSDRVKGIAYTTALDIVQNYGENLTANDVNSYICGGQCSPCVTFCEGRPDDFKVRSTSSEKRDYPSLLDAQRAYYDDLYARQTLAAEKRRLQSFVNPEIKALSKRLSNIESKLAECRDAEAVKLKGELITANIYAIQRGMDGFEAVNYYDENGGKIRIALDKTLTPSQNAQKYYKRYAKLKRTQEIVSKQRDEVLERQEYLASALVHVNNAESLMDLEEIGDELGANRQDLKKKKKDAPLPFRSYEIGGFKVIAGRNNLQNDRLLKSLSPEDMWLHTQKYHSSHVAVLREGREVPDGVLLAAAEICAYYSDGREGTKIPVDYTLKKFVKKPPKAAAGFVIYTDYKTILVEPAPHADKLVEL